MQTESWGPPAWVFLHSITFNAPKVIKEPMTTQYTSFFTSLQFMLPCKYCRQSYVYFLEKLPIKDYCDTRVGIVYWLYALHNLVNHKLNLQHKKNVKPIPTFDDIVMKYNNMKAIAEKLSDQEMSEFVLSANTMYRPKTLESIDKIMKDPAFHYLVRSGE